jgi:hypothetical protein
MLLAMAIDTALVLLSLLSFAALIATWVAAPLHTEETAVSTAEPAGNTIPA